MFSHKIKHAIGTISSRESAEQGLKALQDTGFSMNKISIIAKNSTFDNHSSSNAPTEGTVTQVEGAKAGAKAGGTTAGLFALAAGLSALLVPGIGFVLGAESILATLLGSGAITAAGSLIGALQGWFVPEEWAKFYDERVSQGDYLVMVKGTEEELHQAQLILSHHQLQEWRVYDISLIG